MFAPAEMAEVDIFVYDEDIEQVAQTVARLGVMHLMDVNTLGEWARDVDTEWRGRASGYQGQERRILRLMETLGIEDQPRPCEGRLDPAEDLASIEKELGEIEKQVQHLQQQYEALQEEHHHWELTMRSLETLAPLSVSISDLRQMQYLHLVAGTMPIENLARLEASLFRIPYAIVPLYRYNGRVLIFAFSAQEHSAILDRALESAFLDPLSLPEEFTGSAQEVLEQVRARQKVVETRMRELEAERRQLAERLEPVLLPMLTRVRRDATIAGAMARFGHRGRVYLIAGWVPKDRVDELRSQVEEASQGRATFEESSPYTPNPSQKVPTLLRHSRLLRPMQMIVSTYGIPEYRELDPTLLVAVTFLVLFGAMFGDLGHGLVLSLIGTLIASGTISRLRVNKDLGYILAACGVSSSVFGLLYGSVFGQEEIIPSLWLKPLEDIPSLLIASVIMGVVILNIGFLFRIAQAVRQRELLEALFDSNGIVGLVLYWNLLAIIGLIAQGKAVPGFLMGTLFIWALALIFEEPLTNLLRGQRPLFEANLFESLVQAFFEFFEALISYISNTLSYVRLGAFAVAHVGLTSVVFLLADLAGGSPLLRWPIIVLGNLVIIGFEGLIVGIQTLRLEYYELFGKFFRGGGVPFEPLILPAMECELTPERSQA
ncbi:MAG: hypothetical protein H5T69_10570 [Chloroflexi bacterium]|nr:hypothetical protein [Chloroflexota bacterium]